MLFFIFFFSPARHYYHVQSEENFAQGNDSLYEQIQCLLFHVRHLGRLLVAQRGVEVMLPRQLVRRVDLHRQDQLVLDEFGDVLVSHFLVGQRSSLIEMTKNNFFSKYFGFPLSYLS